MFWYEVGGLSAVAGVLPWTINGHSGALDPADVEATIRPNNIHFPDTTLVCIENTNNRAGGTIIMPEQIKAINDVTRAHNVKVYMDEARIFNASIALRCDVKEFSRHVDNLMFCLSKELSCPVGSLIVGEQGFIDRARKVRKMLRGGMRRAGVIAAPGIIALEKMIDCLAEDHANARLLAEGLTGVDGIEVHMNAVQTNIFLFSVENLSTTAERFIDGLNRKGLLVSSMEKYTIRLVTHGGVEKEDVRKALSILHEVAQGFNR